MIRMVFIISDFDIDFFYSYDKIDISNDKKIHVYVIVNNQIILNLF